MGSPIWLARRQCRLKSGINWLAWSVKLFIMSSAVYFFSFVSADPDLWGHVQFGEDLWRTKSFSPHNLYAFTASDHPWINHEWLSELIFYAVYHFLGGAGLLFFKLGIGLVIVWLISKIALFRQAQVILLGIGLGLAISVMSPGFMVRPHILSFLGFTCFFYIFHCYFDKNENRLWLLPLIMLIWCNSHGGFLIGWGQFTIVVIWESLFFAVKDRKTGPSLRKLFFWYLFTSVACFFNPYGSKLLIFLFHSLSQARPIEEWNPVGIWDTTFIRFKILVALFVISCAYPLGHKKRWEGAMIAATIFFAFRHQRHIPFFAIMVGPSLVEWLTLLFNRLKVNLGNRTSGRVSHSIVTILLLFIVGYHLSHATYRYLKAGFHIFVDPFYYPVQAVEFMQANQIEGNLMLPFEWGEYAIWKLYPQCRVSIDGRFRTAYPEDVLKDHIFPVNDEAAWSRLISKYPTDIILSRQITYFWNLIKTSNEWIYVYSDRAAMIFVRDNKQNQGVLNKFRNGRLIYPNEPVSHYFP